MAYDGAVLGAPVVRGRLPCQVQLDLVWDPPWNPDMMSEAAKLDLGMV